MRDPLTASFLEKGWAVAPLSPATLAWVKVAAQKAEVILSDPGCDQWYRHGRTWFVGVDVLDNDRDGALGPLALAGPALTLLGALGYPVTDWHRAQISAVFPGYPGRDPTEAEATATFRRDRDAAHIDGLLPIGPSRRRMLKEPHAFVLGLPLTPRASGASPLAVWEGSHRPIGRAFREVLDQTPESARKDLDLTDVYQDARRKAFKSCPRVLISAEPGEALVLHRHLLHGISPWTGEHSSPRVLAYFRPQTNVASWLDLP